MTVRSQEVYTAVKAMAERYWIDRCGVPETWLRIPKGYTSHMADQTPVRIQEVDRGVYRVGIDLDGWDGLTWAEVEVYHLRPLALDHVRSLREKRKLAAYAHQHGIRYPTLVRVAGGMQPVPNKWLWQVSGARLEWVD